MPEAPPTPPPPPMSDEWSRWLLNARFGGSAGYEAFVRQDVQRFCRRVLDGAHLAPGMTLVDVGAGEGLIAFDAIARVGPSLQVVLTDISAPLLAHAQQRATALGIAPQCRFVQAGAEKLEGIAATSADVVTTRAALAYVGNKVAAMMEFHRILKPGGRLSLCEPIMQDEALEACALGRMLAAQPNHPDIAYLRLLHRWKSAQYPATEEQISRHPTTNFNERDLVRLARRLGFKNVHLELHIDYLQACDPGGAAGGTHASWDVFLSVAPHPWAPPLKQILAGFTPEERQTLESVLRPQVESQKWIASEVVAYLTAEKAS